MHRELGSLASSRRASNTGNSKARRAAAAAGAAAAPCWRTRRRAPQLLGLRRGEQVVRRVNASEARLRAHGGNEASARSLLPTHRWRCPAPWRRPAAPPAWPPDPPQPPCWLQPGPPQRQWPWHPAPPPPPWHPGPASPRWRPWRPLLPPPPRPHRPGRLPPAPPARPRQPWRSTWRCVQHLPPAPPACAVAPPRQPSAAQPWCPRQVHHCSAPHPPAPPRRPLRLRWLWGSASDPCRRRCRGAPPRAPPRGAAPPATGRLQGTGGGSSPRLLLGALRWSASCKPIRAMPASPVGSTQSPHTPWARGGPWLVSGSSSPGGAAGSSVGGGTGRAPVCSASWASAAEQGGTLEQWAGATGGGCRAYREGHRQGANPTIPPMAALARCRLNAGLLQLLHHLGGWHRLAGALLVHMGCGSSGRASGGAPTEWAKQANWCGPVWLSCQASGSAPGRQQARAKVVQRVPCRTSAPWRADVTC